MTRSALIQTLSGDSKVTRISVRTAWHEANVRRIAFLLVLAMSLLGLALRASAARVLPLYIDEGHTLLGALGVLHHGIPLLPSGVLYLHGATMSYLLAPFAALGWADLDHVGLLRTIPVFLGTAVVPVAAFLAFKLTPMWWVSVATAALVSLDALSIHWSAYVRMYPALQLITVGVALCVVTFAQCSVQLA